MRVYVVGGPLVHAAQVGVHRADVVEDGLLFVADVGVDYFLLAVQVVPFESAS